MRAFLACLLLASLINACDDPEIAPLKSDSMNGVGGGGGEAGGSAGAGNKGGTSGVGAGGSPGSSAGNPGAPGGSSGGAGASGGSGATTMAGAGGVVLTPICDPPAEPPSAGICVVHGGNNKNECNPVTNDGCSGAGVACDFKTATGRFQCFPPPNEGVLCGPCDNKTIFCGPGLNCDPASGKCGKYCCSDADCGGEDTCVPFLPADYVGLCFSKNP